jgi:hypothetical protein
MPLAGILGLGLPELMVIAVIITCIILMRRGER